MPSGKPRAPSAEAEFLSRYDPAAYDRFAVAVDVVLLSTEDRQLRTLLVKRDDFPFKGRYALPGGFVGAREDLARAAARIAQAKAGVGEVYLEQLCTFGDVHRDPRMRVISVAYFALLEATRFAPLAARGPARVATLRVPWEGETGGPLTAHDEAGDALPLAFDHDHILGLVVKRLRGKLAYLPLAQALLGKTFTLLDWQRVHEAILGTPLNKDAFRRKLLAQGWVQPTGTLQSGVVHRPAELFTASPTARRLLAPR
jgi:8-oxo-dGTP diphosphatase